MAFLIAHDGRRQLAHQGEHILAEVLDIGGGMVGHRSYPQGSR